jgi:hypothetical protein
MRVPPPSSPAFSRQPTQFRTDREASIEDSVVPDTT